MEALANSEVLWSLAVLIGVIGWVTCSVIESIGEARAKEHERPSVEHLELQAGDTVLVTLPGPMTVEKITQLRDMLKERLPEGVGALVVPTNTTVTVLAPEEAEHA